MTLPFSSTFQLVIVESDILRRLKIGRCIPQSSHPQTFLLTSQFGTR